MKLLRLEIRGTIPHRDVTVDFTKLDDAREVAVTGPNGAGKTSLFEIIVGIFWRTMPSRGMLASIANDPNSLFRVEVEEAGIRIVAEVGINGTTGKYTKRSFVIDGIIEMAPGGKLEEYQAAVEKYLPPKDVYLASAFGSSSGAGRFLDIDPADRRALLVRLIGIERWQEKADAAGKRAKETKTKLDIVQGKLQMFGGVHGPTCEEIEAAREKDGLASAALGNAETLYKTQLAQLQLWKEKAADIRADKVAAEKESEATSIRFEEARQARRHLEIEEQNLRSRLASKEALEVTAAQECEDVEAIIAKINEAEKGWQEFEKALVEWRHECSEIKRKKGIACAAVDIAEKKIASLLEVPCNGKQEFSACPVLKDAISARDELPTLKKELTEAEAIQEPPQPEPPDMSEADELKNRLPNIRKNNGGIASAQQELAKLSGASERLEKVAEEIGLAEAREKQASIDATTARERVSSIVEAERGHAKTRPVDPDEKQVALARASLTAAQQELTRLQERARTAEEAADKKKAVREEVDALTADLDDWNTLQKACGPKGIQAYLIDAAAPDISAICNDLLHACYGTRFTVRLTTQAAAAKRGDMKEVCELTVLDNEKGTDSSADVKSTGERTILSEAFSAAVMVYNKRRSDKPIDDFFRDECAGDLDMANKPLYMSMVRKAIELGDFHRGYCVLHEPDLWELADARLHVEGGKVAVK